MLRPSFAHDAVEALQDGRVCAHFKAPWRSGAAHADMSPGKLMPVADGVGTLDPERTEQVIHTLLAGIVQHAATVAIVDITGLQMIDTSAADGLLRAAGAIRLLGTEFGDLVTLGDLKAGIAHAIARRRR